MDSWANYLEHLGAHASISLGLCFQWQRANYSDVDIEMMCYIPSKKHRLYLVLNFCERLTMLQQQITCSGAVKILPIILYRLLSYFMTIAKSQSIFRTDAEVNEKKSARSVCVTSGCCRKSERVTHAEGARGVRGNHYERCVLTAGTQFRVGIVNISYNHRRQCSWHPS